MKKAFQAILLIVICFLIASYFIPVIQQKEIPVSNTLENIVSSLSQPQSWIKWDASVRDAWQNDSTKCQFTQDSAKHVITINFQGKKITVTQTNYLSFQLEETSDHNTDYFILSVAPYIEKEKPQSNQNSKIAYAWNSTLFYKIFPFFHRTSFCEETISSLASYLNDQVKYYGFPIKIKTASDIFFITRKDSISRSGLFKTLHILFDSLDLFCHQNHLQSGNHNAYYDSLPGDSLKILAGINIDKAFIVEGINQFMQLPPTQVVAIADFEGPFRDRSKVYQAMKKYFIDKELIKSGVCFEKYLSPLPISDTSIIKMELVYPIRSFN